MPDAQLIADWIWFALVGIGVGFVAAAPIGAVNVICIRRTLQYGPLNGFLSGMGAAIGDGSFAAITAFGFTKLYELIAGYSLVLEIFGGLILIGYGIYALMSKPKIPSLEPTDDENSGTSAGGLFSAMASTYVLTIINPATLIFFAAFVGGLSGLVPGGTSSYAAASVFVLSVIAGSAVWWLVIVTITFVLHRQIGEKSVVMINRVTGVLIGAFGVAVLIKVAADLSG